jgi:hypothetical protein
MNFPNHVPLELGVSYYLINLFGWDLYNYKSYISSFESWFHTSISVWLIVSMWILNSLRVYHFQHVPILMEVWRLKGPSFKVVDMDMIGVINVCY